MALFIMCWSGNDEQSHDGRHNFCGVKECMGNDRIKLLADKGIMCWSGNDEQSHDGRHNFGGLGVISVTSNVVPGLMKKLMTEKDDALNAKLKKIFGWLFEEPNPIGVNTLLMQLGYASPCFVCLTPCVKKRRGRR